MNRLLEALHSGRVLLMDGAMGTELQRRGLKDGEPPDLWNLTNPDAVRAVHQSYLDAGAEILLTNTFQANRRALTQHGLQDRLADIWSTAIEHVRCGHDRAPILLADIGPGEESGSLEYTDGVDGILLETWSCLPSVRLHPPSDVLSQKPEVPVLLSFAFQHHPGRRGPGTHEGATPEHCASAE